MNKQNIEVTSDFNDFVIFKTECQCSSDNHRLSVCVEKESKDSSGVMTSLYFQVGWRDKYSDNIFRKILGRIKAAFSILFKGYLDLDGDFMFRNPNHLKDFRNTLEEAINQVERASEDNI